MDELSLATMVDPDSAQAHFFLGRALQRLGRHEEAVDPLAKAVALRGERIS